MYRIKYMGSAKENLREIEEYYDKIDVRLTNKILAGIDKRILELKDMPFRWRRYPDNPGYRVIGVYSYLIFYIVDEENQMVEIHRVLHSARNIEREMKKNIEGIQSADEE